MARSRRRSGFTLIELLIVVFILGALASIVVAQFRGVSIDAEQAAFIVSAQTFVSATQRFYIDNGYYPNAPPDTLAAGMEDYISAQYWAGGTPVGGVWDCARNSWGVTASLGVFYPPAGNNAANVAYMQEIDDKYDDGDLTTGMFRRMSAAHYFFVVAE